MNEEQLNIYDKFANEEEPLLLINFEPFDLLKLYIHAYLEDNQEVLSNLFVSEHNLQQKLYEFLTMNDKFLLRLDNNKEERSEERRVGKEWRSQWREIHGR